MTGMLRMRRSRGVVSGFVLMLLGLWGGLIPFIGPYFNYAYTPDTAWTYNTARLWLEVLPGAAVFLGGILLIISARRHIALFGAALAAAGGAWFTLGTVFSPLWNNNVQLGGSPASATVVMRIAEQVGFFTGLGVVIVAIASFAFGRIISLPVEAAPVVAGTEVAGTETVPADSTGRPTRPTVPTDSTETQPISSR